MAATDRCLASMARLSLASSTRPVLYTAPRFLAPASTQGRHLITLKNKPGAVKTKPKKKPLPKEFMRPSLLQNSVPQYSLVEAMRILRAVEVGQPPNETKYDMHINLRANRGGRVIRNSVQLPHPVRTNIRTAVICPEGSDIARKAMLAGAVAVGEKAIFNNLRLGKGDYDRVICLDTSVEALEKADLKEKLAEDELVVSVETGTVLPEESILEALEEAPDAEPYREKQGLLSMPIGKLSYDPTQLKENVKAAMASINNDCNRMSEGAVKAVHEVLLSSTNGPALSLSGQWHHEDDTTDPKVCEGPM